MEHLENFYNQARTYEEQEEFDLAAHYYEQALKFQVGDQALAHQGRGRSLARLGEFQEAIVECQKALNLNSKLPIAHGVLGDIFFSQKQYRLAKKEYLVALDLNPKDFIALVHLSDIYAKLGDLDKSLLFLEKSLQLQPDNLDLQIALINRYIYHSQQKQAIKLLKKLFQAKPTSLSLYLLCARFLTRSPWEGQKYKPMTRVALAFLISVILTSIVVLSPLVVSISVGVLLIIYATLKTIVYLWIKKRGGTISPAPLLITYIYCIFYGVLIFDVFIDLLLSATR